MDGGFQESYNCTPDDSGRVTRCYVGVSIKPQEHVGYKQLHGRYVQNLAAQAYVHTVCYRGSDIVYHSGMSSSRTLLIVLQFKRMARISATIRAT